MGWARFFVKTAMFSMYGRTWRGIASADDVPDGVGRRGGWVVEEYVTESQPVIEERVRAPPVPEKCGGR